LKLIYDYLKYAKYGLHNFIIFRVEQSILASREIEFVAFYTPLPFLGNSCCAPHLFHAFEGIHTFAYLSSNIQHT